MTTDLGSTPPLYHSFLLRLWRESEHGVWRASLENVVTGQRHGFPDLPRLFAFLRTEFQAAALDPENRAGPPDRKPDMALPAVQVIEAVSSTLYLILLALGEVELLDQSPEPSGSEPPPGPLKFVVVIDRLPQPSADQVLGRIVIEWARAVQ